MKEFIRFVFVLCYTDLYININILGRKSDCKKMGCGCLRFEDEQRKKNNQSNKNEGKSKY